MSFSFLGGGGGGQSGAIVTMRSKNFRNIDPSSSDFFQVWDPSDPTLPEPDFCHILVTTRLPYMNHLTAADSPGCCGAAFGYKVFMKGNVPQKLYAWRGGSGPPSLPYTYSDNAYFSGFNDSPVRGGGYELPLAAKQSAMGSSDTTLPGTGCGKSLPRRLERCVQRGKRRQAGGIAVPIRRRMVVRVPMARSSAPAAMANEMYGGGTGGDATT